MKLSILLCLLLVQVVFTYMPTVYEFCSHVVANGECGQTTCDGSQCQGKPGKVGPAGSTGIQGLKGQKGENGTSEGMAEKVRILEGSLKELSDGLRSSPSTKDAVCYMGMKSGYIPDSAITSSSDAGRTFAAYLGRLDNQESGFKQGAWFAGTNRVDDAWIQVDLGHPEVVAGVITQGKSGNWVKSYKVSCGNKDGNMATITEHGQDKVFTANTDSDTKVVNTFPQLMTCRYIRIYPQTYDGHMTMRLEIIRGICKDIY